MARYSEDFPRGDNGGSSAKFSLTYSEKVKTLHELWDSAVTKFLNGQKYVSLWLVNNLQPLSEESWWFIGNTSAKIQEEYPRSSFPDLDAPHTEWHNENYQLALDYAYDGYVEGGHPDEEYIKRGIKVCERQIAKGGYRLADLLVKYLKDITPRSQISEEPKFLQTTEWKE